MKINRTLLYIFIAVIILALGSVVFWKYQNNISKTKTEEPKTVLKEKESLTIGNTSLDKSVYPENTAEALTINFNSYIFEPLIAFNAENKIIPRLAEKWDNPDNNTWRFYLSSNAKFSNGTPVTAADVKFSYDYIVDKDLEMKVLLPKATINVVNNTTVEFKTTSPNPVLLNKLAMDFFILSKKDVEASGLKNHIGSGPYVLTSYSENEAKLIRNENYWRINPKIKNVTFKVYAKEDDQVNALLNKEIDIATSITERENINKINKAAANNSLQKMVMTRAGGITYLSLDTTKDKTPFINTPINPLKDLKVRKAVYQAIDIQAIIKSIPNKLEVSNQLVSRGISGYNPSIVRPPYSLANAKALMKEAGYENGFDLTIDYLDVNPRAKPEMQEVANQLANIGIKATLNGEPDIDKFYTKIDARDTSVYRTSYASDSKDAEEVLELLVHTPSESFGTYNLGYSNPEVDKLIESTSKSMDQKIRQKELQDAMKIAMDDIAVIPLFEEFDLFGYANDIYWPSRADGSLKVDEMAGK